MSPRNRSLPGIWGSVLLAYLLLLVASHLWQNRTGVTTDRTGFDGTVAVQPVAKGTPVADGKLPISYRQQNPEGEPESTVVLLHGASGDHREVEQLMPHLSDRYRVLVPVFPGYVSEISVPDYSLRSRAAYLAQFLDSLQVGPVHLVGHHQGGGVAINLAHRHPEKVRSLTLVSASGIQELELLGSHGLNRAAYGLQLGILWILQEAVPHFGVMDDHLPGRSYARSFYDSDQRPIRGYLSTFSEPVLLQHGREDGLVPAVVAQEHYRIVPQSELLLYAQDHDLLVEQTEQVAADLNRFLVRVDSGQAPTAAEADSARITASRQHFETIRFSPFEGVNLLILVLVIVIATFISEDLACIGTGLLVARGIITFWPAAGACFLGILIGDMGCYFLGRWVGPPALRHAPLKWVLSESDIRRSAAWFDAKGPAIIVASRFLPGSRFPTYFSAGMIGVGFWMFFSHFLIAAVIWTPMLVGLSTVLGNSLIDYFNLYRHYAIWVITGVVLLFILLVKYGLPLIRIPMAAEADGEGTAGYGSGERDREEG